MDTHVRAHARTHMCSLAHTHAGTHTTSELLLFLKLKFKRLQFTHTHTILFTTSGIKYSGDSIIIHHSYTLAS